MSSFDVQQPIVELPDQDPDPAFSDDELVWTDEEEAQIEAWKDQYPEDQAAIMKVLWLAQEKFGYLAPEVIQLCADTLDMTFTQAYGVATFYHQYFKEEKGTYVLDVCTCFTCQVCGGYETCCTTWRRSWAFTPARRPTTGCLRSRRPSAWGPAARRP
jgi:NADH-quinone oxidoreductase subunit E